MRGSCAAHGPSRSGYEPVKIVQRFFLFAVGFICLVVFVTRETWIFLRATTRYSA